LLYQNTPIFLTEDSGYNKKQCEQINVIVRTTRNRFISKAKQEQLGHPKIEKFISQKYNRVLNLFDFLYDKTFSISFILDSTGFEKNIDYPLFEFTEKNIISMAGEGSNSDLRTAINLSALGTFSIKKQNGIPTIYFTCLTDNWPTDESGKKIFYSVYIGGKIE